MPQIAKPYRVPVKLAAVPFANLEAMCEMEGSNRTEILTRGLMALVRGKGLDPMKVYLDRTHKDEA